MLSAKNILADLKHLFYPHVCCGCGSDILADDTLLCAKCYLNLPATLYARYAGNPIEKIFWGRIRLAAAHAEFYFVKDGLVQELVHQLKYNGNREIGVFLGQMMGRTLLNSDRFKNIDAIIPLPMYPDKERKRGYNQAAVISSGLSGILQVPVFNHYLQRTRLTETQTKKHRAERWENVEGSFFVPHPPSLQGKHLLLVDDVITTGATLEAAGNRLLQTEGVTLSLATLATAVK